MDFSALAKARYSVRSFKSDGIEDEKIKKILEVGLSAPSACNFQPWRIYVVKSEETRKELATVCKYTFDAPVILVICYNKEESWKNKRIEGYQSGETDAAILCTHLMLEAFELGIGSCWVGCFNPESVKQVLKITDERIVVSAMLPIGYPSDESTPNERHTTYRDISETVVEI